MYKYSEGGHNESRHMRMVAMGTGTLRVDLLRAVT